MGARRSWRTSNEIMRDAEKRAALAVRSPPESAGRGAALPAVPGSQCRRQLHRPVARWIAAGDFSDPAAAGAHDEVQPAVARLSRDRSGPPFPGCARARERRAAAASASFAHSVESRRSAKAGDSTPSGWRRNRMVRRRSRGVARPARLRAVPGAPAGRRYRPARQALDAPAGDRLRHRGERESSATS